MWGLWSGCWRGASALPDKICAFLDAVAGEIRWTRARPRLTEEIACHLLEQQADYLAEGMSPADAEEEAVRQMGDPVSLGAELDRIHRPRPQWGLLAMALGLMTAGALMRYLLPNGVLPREEDLLVIPVGALCLIFGYVLDISALGRHPLLCLAALTAGTAAVFLTYKVQGVSWIAQRLMVLFPAALGVLLWSLRGRWWRGVLAGVAAFGLVGVAAILIPSMLTLTIITVTGIAMGLLLSRLDWFGIGRRKTALLTLVLGGAVLGGVARVILPRLRGILHPELEIPGVNFLVNALRGALRDCRWLGPKVELSSNALGGALVEMEGGALLVSMVFHWGWLPFLALMAAFFGFFLWALRRTLHLRQTLGRTVCTGILTALLTQSFFSLLLTFGFPLFSAPFPLLVGNWYTVVNMFLIGLMLSAFRDGALPERAAPGAKAIPEVWKIKPTASQSSPPGGGELCANLCATQ